MNQSNKKVICVDINADLGEGTTLEDCENDQKLMKYISSCNIACGGHAGNDLTMRTSLKNAADLQLKIGAHPGYEDKENFGRISIKQTQQKLETSLKQQINYLKELAFQQNIRLQHIKFHGALYNDLESDKKFAKSIATFCKHFYPSTKLMGLAGGFLQSACKLLNIKFIAEGFMDRRYLASGSLSPRTQLGSIITEQKLVIEQATALALQEPIKTIDQQTIFPNVDSICLHGDNPNALSIAKKLNKTMNSKGIIIL